MNDSSSTANFRRVCAGDGEVYGFGNSTGNETSDRRRGEEEDSHSLGLERARKLGVRIGGAKTAGEAKHADDSLASKFPVEPNPGGSWQAVETDAPSSRLAAESFCLLQKWEGIVEEILAETVRVRLIDLMRRCPDEQCTLNLEEFSEDDRECLRMGVPFYLYVGYHDLPSGQRKRETMIYVKRHVRWGHDDLQAAEDWASIVAREIQWDVDGDGAEQE